MKQELVAGEMLYKSIFDPEREKLAYLTANRGGSGLS